MPGGGISLPRRGSRWTSFWMRWKRLSLSAFAIGQLVEAIAELTQLTANRLELRQNQVLPLSGFIVVRRHGRVGRLHSEGAATLTGDDEALVAEHTQRQPHCVSRNAVAVHELRLAREPSTRGDRSLEDRFPQHPRQLPVERRVRSV